MPPNRLREALARHVERGEVPGVVAGVSRHGETRVEVLASKAVAWTEFWLGTSQR